MDNLDNLAALIEREREGLLDSWRRQVRELPSAARLSTPTLNDHIPALLDELAGALRSMDDASIPDSLLSGSSPRHGLQRQSEGFDIVEVVAEYNILRGCIHTLAESHGVRLEGTAFHILNRVLDEAIGLAVQTFVTQQNLEIQKRREEHLAFIAHDLRTPLSAIAFAVRLLEETASGGAATIRGNALGTLQRNVRHLERLIQSVLKESANVQAEGGVRPERRDIDLWPLVEELKYEMRPLATTAATTIHNEVPPEITVHADAGLLRRIIQNLLANSIKHTPRGNVWIGATVADDDTSVTCFVRDDGTGIPRDRLAQIFDKFESDDQGDEVSGLGLPIVKSLVEAHGGTVEVDSTEGTGSTFRFALPARET